MRLLQSFERTLGSYTTIIGARLEFVTLDIHIGPLALESFRANSLYLCKWFPDAKQGSKDDNSDFGGCVLFWSVGRQR